ncbi:MAG: exodeoxyribonuclease VII large subunit [Solirubrobacterales bacterium]
MATGDQPLEGFGSAQAPLELPGEATAPALGPPPVAAGPEATAEPDDGLAGPFAVGRYARELRGFLRRRPRLKLIGEITGLRVRAKSVFFELRDGTGAVNCSMWRSDWDELDLPEGAVRDGAEVVVAGGPDYYPGSATASPSFSFRCTDVRPAGEGDLLAQLAELRRRLEGEGLFEPQRRLPRPGLPRTIGIVTGRGSAAEADLLAGLERRGWRGTAVFAHPPVQDRHAAPQISRAVSDLAGIAAVEVILIARGGGSLADLWAFCDENLCRTVALLRVPVISAVGHESDRTLLDDVAAVSCSTPTHATEEAVRIDVGAARARIRESGIRLSRHGAAAAPERARRLAGFARALGHHTDGQRRRLHQMIREIRASARRAIEDRAADSSRRALVLGRKRDAALHSGEGSRRELAGRAASLRRHRDAASAERSAELDRLAQTLAALEPERVLERGYAIVEPAGAEADGADVITTAERARREGRVRVRFSDDHVEADVRDD